MARIIHPSMVLQLPQVIEGPYDVINLVGRWNAFYVIVEPGHHAVLSQYRWSGSWNKTNGALYARRHEGSNGQRKIIYMHGEVLMISQPGGFQPGLKGDHIHRFTLDNRASQLRWVTDRESVLNRSIRCLNLTGYRGASVDSGGNISVVVSRSCQDQVTLSCRFQTLEEAAWAYNYAVLLIDPELKFHQLNLNLPVLDTVRQEEIQWYVERRMAGIKEMKCLYPCVYPNHKKFRADYGYDNNRLYTGTFTTQEQAYYSVCYLRWGLTGFFDDSLLPAGQPTEEERKQIEQKVWEKYRADFQM